MKYILIFISFLVLAFTVSLDTYSWNMLCEGDVTIEVDSYNQNNLPIWSVSCNPYDVEPTITPSQTLEPTSTPTLAPTNTPSPVNYLIINHNSVELFDSIPEYYKNLALGKSLFFMDQSVGGNIYAGLDCLSYTHSSAPSHCKRWNHTGVPSYSVDPSEVYWDSTYPVDNITYKYWTDVGSNCTNSVNDMINCFLQEAENQKLTKDYLSFQVSYLQVDGNNNWIIDLFDELYRLDDWENQNPNKEIIYWTTSLSRGIGTQISTDFNNQMRQYAIQNNKVLFDVADILSHDPDGNPCYDNRDGVQYAFGTRSENYPDDGLNIPAICPHYTTEVQGGHLGSVSAGKIRVAKAFWVMVAQLSGWTP